MEQIIKIKNHINNPELQQDIEKVVLGVLKQQEIGEDNIRYITKVIEFCITHSPEFKPKEEESEDSVRNKIIQAFKMLVYVYEEDIASAQYGETYNSLREKMLAISQQEKINA